MTITQLMHLANYSDGVLYALAFLLLIALAIIIDRFWYLRRTILGGRRLVLNVAQHGRISYKDLETLHASAGQLPESTILETALRTEGRVDNTGLESLLDEAIMLVAPRLDRRLWVLDTIITLAPLLGLFGTILGMFRAFSVLARPGSPPIAVTGGVADALITTAAGIFVAMIGLLTYNGLNNLVRQIIHQMDTIKTLLLNRIASHHVTAITTLGAAE